MIGVKKIIFSAALLTLALLLTVKVSAAGKAAPKATGSIEAVMYGGAVHLYADFNGISATATQPDKGNYHVWGSVFGQNIDWYGDINSVTVGGQQAILHGTFVSGVADGNPSAGTPFSLKMTDGGSPGAGNDTFSSEWGITDNPSFAWTIVSGNLVVHN